MAGVPDGEIITFTVRNARPVDSKVLFALVDVDLEIAGVLLTIAGIQVRRLPCRSLHLI